MDRLYSVRLIGDADRDMKRFLKYFSRPYRMELFLWIGLLLAPILIDPSKSHSSLCLFHNLGIDFCPGCGLGRSLAYFYRGDLAHSFLANPLGIILFGILIFRIISLTIKLTKTNHSLEGGTNG